MMAKKKMRTCKRIALLVSALCLLATTGVYAANNHFTMKRKATKNINLKQRISVLDQTIPLDTVQALDALSLTADITLRNARGYIRAVLVDTSGREYLVYEANALTALSHRFSIKNGCEETCILDGVQGSHLRFEMEDARMDLKRISLSSGRPGIKRAAIARTRRAQNLEKLEKIREKIKSEGYRWKAGETRVSAMTYAEKKRLLGGDLPNLYGFEYFKGGIFELPSITDATGEGNLKAAAAASSPYVDEFSWKFRHGEDWVTSVKDQASCGSCWAFAATATTELLVNLYYNRHLDMDLAEQDALSCSGAGDCDGGWPGTTLDYFTTNGVVDESCFPYSATEETCDNKCTMPAETVRIGGRTYFSSVSSADDDLKALIIDGPVSGGIYSWSHAMLLFGYKVLEAGDYIYLRSDSTNGWVTIPEGDPLVGRTAWHVKNSWGTDWGDNGFAYIVIDTDDIGWTYAVHGPVTSVNYDDSDIECVDRDGDGYFSWGLGGKPAHCPASPNEPDGDDANPCFGPVDAYGHLEDLCSSGNEIDLGAMNTDVNVHVDNTATLSITQLDWSGWVPRDIVIAMRPADGYVMDGMSVDVDGTTTALSGWWQSITTRFTSQEEIPIEITVPAQRDVVVRWWAQ